MKSPKPIKFNKGWLRWINVESDKPITLPKAPWEQADTEKESK